MTVEKRIEKKLCDGVRRRGGIAVKFWSVSFAGFPDRIVLLPEARINFVELKSTGKKPSPRQLYVIGLLRRLGFPVTVIDSEDRLNEYFKKLDDDL